MISKVPFRQVELQISPCLVVNGHFASIVNPSGYEYSNGSGIPPITFGNESTVQLEEAVELNF